MKPHTYTSVQRLPVPLATAWEFFATPANLERITPPEMRFRITGGDAGRELFEGMRLSYTLYPFPFLPVSWQTVITMVQRPAMFEDRQLEGPYESWVHRHEFRAVAGGTEMTDRVAYSLPFGMLGEAVGSLIVARRLEEVFEYRKARIAELLGTMEVVGDG